MNTGAILQDTGNVSDAAARDAEPLLEHAMEGGCAVLKCWRGQVPHAHVRMHQMESCNVWCSRCSFQSQLHVGSRFQRLRFLLGRNFAKKRQN